MKNVMICLLFISVLSGCSTTSNLPPDTSISTPEKINDYIRKNKSTIIKTIGNVTPLGVNQGFKQWAKKNSAAATEAATALSNNIETQLVPYFDGDKMMTSGQVQDLLETSLFNKVPDEAKLALVTAFAVLDYYLPVPDSATYLTKDQKDIIIAFLNGVKKGCDNFTATKEIKPKRSTSWVR